MYVITNVWTIIAVLGPVEADPEYQLIVESNNMLVELDTEISMFVLTYIHTYIVVVCIITYNYIDVIHKFTRDNYARRFPELESLIHTPVEYIKTVKVRPTYFMPIMCTGHD